MDNSDMGKSLRIEELEEIAPGVYGDSSVGSHANVSQGWHIPLIKP